MEQHAAVCTGCNNHCAESGAGTAEASTELANIVARHRFRSRGNGLGDVVFLESWAHVCMAKELCEEFLQISAASVSRGAEELDVEFRQRFFHPVLRALQKCRELDAEAAGMPPPSSCMCPGATPGGDSVEESDKIVEELAEEVTTAGSWAVFEHACVAAMRVADSHPYTT